MNGRKYKSPYWIHIKEYSLSRFSKLNKILVVLNTSFLVSKTKSNKGSFKKLLYTACIYKSTEINNYYLDVWYKKVICMSCIVYFVV